MFGGDFYTAYTVIAVPALVYAVGAYGFFALPYTIIVYPFVFAVMPRLWRLAHRHGYVTAADVVRGQLGSKPLELAIALTGVLAVMPYIALQLIGMATVIKALELNGELPLIVAFVILAVYAYSSGLRAPAAIAFIKDIMIYIAVVAAIAGDSNSARRLCRGLRRCRRRIQREGFRRSHPAFEPICGMRYAGARLCPRGLHVSAYIDRGLRQQRRPDGSRKNAILLPAYTLLLGLLALLGYMAHAVQLNISDNNEVVPALFQTLFPSWFAGFAFAAIAIGALVPAAVMSIGAANLFARNFWRAHIDPQISAAAEAKVAKIASLVVQIGAVFAVIFLPIQFALYLQLLGGMWIIQILPALVFGLYTPSFRATALLAGWAGICREHISPIRAAKPLHAIHLGPIETTVYTALLALGVNIVVAVVAQTISPSRVGSPAAKTSA